MTAETRVMCLVAAALCGFFFRLGEQPVGAQLPTCPRHDCKDVYGWWINGTPGGNQCFVAKETGTQTNTTHALLQVYATASSGTTPANNLGTYDRHIFSNCFATCGQVNGQWQSPQEVTPTGTSRLDGNRTRQVCTPKAIPGGD